MLSTSTPNSDHQTSTQADGASVSLLETQNPFNWAAPGELKESCEPFLQPAACLHMGGIATDIFDWCLGCRQRSTGHCIPGNEDANNTCQFYGFRLLRFSCQGRLMSCGFHEPSDDPSTEERSFWRASPKDTTEPAGCAQDTARFVLSSDPICDSFCRLATDEARAIAELRNVRQLPIVWKRVVGSRESCDFCETTLFHLHWVCRRCGCSLCVECFNADKSPRRFDTAGASAPSRECEAHCFVPCQIIPDGELERVSEQMHDQRSALGLEQHCGCPLALKSNAETKAPRPSKSAEDHSDPSVYTLICDEALLWLHSPKHPSNLALFQSCWKLGKPVLVSGVQLDPDLWNPNVFAQLKDDQGADLFVDLCDEEGRPLRASVKTFMKGFDRPGQRPKDRKKRPLLKLANFPAFGDFSELLPEQFSDLMNAIPLPEYTHRDGRFNLVAHLPKEMSPPELGPKTYAAYGSVRPRQVYRPHRRRFVKLGTTNLHLDISDAVNVLAFASVNGDQRNRKKLISRTVEAVMDSGCREESMLQRIKNGEVPGAIWHIFLAKYAPAIRDFLNKLEASEADGDPIHDQSWYIDDDMLNKLSAEYQVRAVVIVQFPGDAIFLPAGCPHQVRNLNSCIKVAEDFVAPESVAHCVRLTREFCRLSANHANRADKLQIKNICYHAIKNSIAALMPPATVARTMDDAAQSNTPPKLGSKWRTVLQPELREHLIRGLMRAVQNDSGLSIDGGTFRRVEQEIYDKAINRQVYNRLLAEVVYFVEQNGPHMLDNLKVHPGCCLHFHSL